MTGTPGAPASPPDPPGPRDRGPTGGATPTPGPLVGYRVVELAGLGPAPFAAMMLADMGADVVRIDRIDRVAQHAGQDTHQDTDQDTDQGGDKFTHAHWDLLNRGKRSIAIDLKCAAGVALALCLIDRADVLIEGFRPGVAERLGLGPDVCMARNPGLVYGRMTGWGQDGPLAHAAGHDINYIALSGVLAHCGRADGPPTPAMNLVGDFGGGGMLLAFGVACALLERGRSDRGQVIDAAMVEGSAVLMMMIRALLSRGSWNERRGDNLLDSGAPFYDAYETSDGRYVSVGALEPQFFAELLQRTGLTDIPAASQYDRSAWPELRKRLTEVFKRHPLAHWCAQLEGTDACIAPVLKMTEAPDHPHNRQRQSFVEVAGVPQPAPAPRFSRSPAGMPSPPPQPGQHTRAVLEDFGFSPTEIAELRRAHAVEG